jgi:outer membrane receptor for ferrienterochelin and colicins
MRVLLQALATQKRCAAQLVVAVAAGSVVTLVGAPSLAKAPGEPTAIAADEVVVSGARREERSADTAADTTVLRRAELQASGAQTVADALDQLAGVEMVREATGSHVRLQGLDPEHTLVVLDGQRLAGRTGGQVDLGRIALADIERIEIVRGPASALYGSDALAGVIHLVSRQPRAKAGALGVTGAELSALYGSGQRRDVSGRGVVQAGQWTAQLQGGWLGRNGWDWTPHDVATQGNAFDEFHGLLQVGHATSAQTGWHGRLQGYWRDQTGVDLAATGAVFDRRQRSTSLQVSAGPKHRWPTGHLHAEVQYSHFADRYVQDQRRSSALDSVQDSQEQVAQGTVQWSQVVAKQQRLTAGLDLLGEWMRSERLGSTDASRQRLALYGEYDWALGGDTARLRLVPGLRADVDSQFGQALSPKLTLRADLGRRLTLRSGYGWGFRAPSFQELYLLFQNPAVGYVVQGNPDLRPEVARGLTGSVEARIHRQVRLNLAGFYNQVQDLIQTGVLPDQQLGTTRYGYLNVARARTYGLDAQLHWQLPARGRWLPRLELGGSWLEAREVNAQGQAGARLVGRPRWRGFGQLAAKQLGWGLDASARLAMTGRRPFVLATGSGDSQIQAGAYALVEARVAKKFGKHLELFVVGENLTNQGDAQFLSLAPRTVSVGLRSFL